MRIIGLDIGERRIGVAVSDPGEKVASPLTVIADLARFPREIARIAEDYEATRIVVGMPLSLDGTEGPQALRIREIGERLAAELPLPVEYYDERLTTAEARKSMRAAGVGSRRQKGAIDKVAAAIMLQGYLDSRAGRPKGSADDG